MLKRVSDILIVGGGHAGIEAAVAAARMGKYVLLITPRLDRVGLMSCNPAIGGIGKSHLVKEIFALGGTMGYIADDSALMSRILNRRKGAAVQATRLQCDRKVYQELSRETVEGTQGLELVEGEAKIIEQIGDRYRVLGKSIEIECHKVIICVGTFIRGLLHFGMEKVPGGRFGDRPSNRIGDSLIDLGVELSRFKTGTPPRIRASSVDVNKCVLQEGDERPRGFTRKLLQITQIPCFITYTGRETKELIEGNLDRSPLYAGEIEGLGPRYCPSFEDKVVKFPEREEHQVFLEPEGREVNEFYLNGLSTSMPIDVQERMVNSIPGMEKAEITQYGYAVEYDYAKFGQIKGTMEAREISGLYLAGQINGTSGYEEAAAQGLIAGINASLSLDSKEEYIPRRDQGYIGVLIDDLLSRQHFEPYRLFTARAEYRLLLREDNAEERFIEDGRRFGLVSDEQYARYEGKLNEKAKLKNELTNEKNEEGRRLIELLKRPEVSINGLIGKLPGNGGAYSEEASESLEIEVKYEGYIQRQLRELERFKEFENMQLPDGFDYGVVYGLSNEGRDALSSRKPKTLAEAGRLAGVNPADVLILLRVLRG